MASVAKRVHFGDFLRWAVDQHDGPTEFAQKRGISLASLTKWTKAPTRDATRMSALSALELAKALNFASVEELDAQWQSTPVEPYPRRANGREPDTSEAAQVERFMRMFPEVIEALTTDQVKAVFKAFAAELVRRDKQPTAGRHSTSPTKGIDEKRTARLVRFLTLASGETVERPASKASRTKR